MFKIWLKSDKFEGIKNPVEDRWHFWNSCWRWWWFWHSWLGLVSLMTLWMVCICSEEALFKIWLKSVEFEGIKNGLKDGWHCWRCGGRWRFLTGAEVLDQDEDVSLKVQWVSVSIFVKIWCLEAEICSVQFCQICCLRRGGGAGGERGGEMGELKDQPRLINIYKLLGSPWASA